MSKAKVTKNGKNTNLADMEGYLATAKDMLNLHDEQLEKIEDSLKALHTKVDRAMSRLGIS